MLSSLKLYCFIRKPAFNVLFECKGNFYPRNIGTDRILRISGLAKQAGIDLHAQIIVDRVGIDKFRVDIGVNHVDGPKPEEAH